MRMAVSAAILRCDSDATLPRVRRIIVTPVLLELLPLEFLNEISLDQIHILEVLAEAGLGVFVSNGQLEDLAFARNLAGGGDGFSLLNNSRKGQERSYALTRTSFLPPSS